MHHLIRQRDEREKNMKLLNELGRLAIEESTHEYGNESDMIIKGFRVECIAIKVDSTLTARKPHFSFRFKLDGKVIAKAKLQSILNA